MDVTVLHKNNRDYVLLPKEEYDSMKATIEALKDADAMEQLKASKGARSRPFGDVVKELGI
jgi:PHD/YefM family antitoxin component YafN of YafNO toxin-antitoxin module